MKILLLGDYSALHKNLKEGLIELGHSVTLASSGDGWKQVPSDLKFPLNKGSIQGKIKYRFDLNAFIRKLKGFDIVQVINPEIFPAYCFRYLLFDALKQNNGKIFLLAAGSDSMYWRVARRELRYGPFDDHLKYDLKSKSDPNESEANFRFNDYVARNVDGIIPIMFEYLLGYSGYSNLRDVIPIPINTSEVDYVKNDPKNKVVVFHGLNRYGFKGTRFVEEAYRCLSEKYRGEMDLIINGKLALSEYLKLMARTNVVIDQTNSYSLGVNGVYALAMGKVVLGGAEPESLAVLGVTKSPIINILPDATSIVSAMEFVMDQRADLERIGHESRLFAEHVHGYVSVAQKYVDAWTR